MKKTSVAIGVLLAGMYGGVVGLYGAAEIAPSSRRASELAMTAYRSDGTVGLMAEVVACWADRPSDFCLYLDLAAHQVEAYAALDHGVPMHGFFQARAVEQRALPVLRGISHHTGIQHRYWQEFEVQMYHEVLPQLERSPLDGIDD